VARKLTSAGKAISAAKAAAAATRDARQLHGAVAAGDLEETELQLAALGPPGSAPVLAALEALVPGRRRALELACQAQEAAIVEALLRA
jgi:hypothetical protein